MFFEWNIVEFVLLNGMDCVLAMLVDTVFETSCFFLNIRKVKINHWKRENAS